MLTDENEIASAEGDLAAMRIHANRLAPGYVRTKMDEALSKMEKAIGGARRSVAASADFVVVEKQEEFESEVAREAWSRVLRALDAGEGPRPRSGHECVALCIHALLASREPGFPGLRCVGVPKQPAATSIDGFAAPVRDLEPGRLLPEAWNAQPNAPAFKYRRDGVFRPDARTPAEIIELECASDKPDFVKIFLVSQTRGPLHDDEIAVDFEGAGNSNNYVLPANRVDELADYVRDVVAPRLAPPEPPAKRPLPSFEPHGMPDARPDPSAKGTKAPFFDGMLVGPSHPVFGGPPSVPAPRHDPLVPGDTARLPNPTFPGAPPRPLKPPSLPGEPNFDHLKPPDNLLPRDDHDSMFL
ncbi:hypothetical protein CTAYLR_003372 [Chrysophaeum taylorii]|uniref:Uncharacterized protein n=1 Tax=Chrysophaeum taylorii TaxID=2483200 RepID=A0AAD7XMF3_9STRA|nr:hypothetical protein CTAYLR_003372 [Chrysophaeum taylorii]